MEENKQQNKETIFVKKYLIEIENKKAPLDFTANVMQGIIDAQTSIVINDKPLISKKIWLLVASFVGICLFFVFQNQNSSKIYFPEIDFNYLSTIELPNLFSSVTVSNGMLLVFGLFTMFFFVQIFFLKNHLDKRFEV